MSILAAVLVLHVLAAILLAGHSFATPLVLAAIRGAPTNATLRPLLLFARDSARASPIAALVLLGTGIWLGAGRWDEGWLQVSAALWLLNSALAGGVVKATGQRLAALVMPAGDGVVSPEADAVRRSPRWDLAAHAMIANDLALLLLMYVQPGLATSVAVTAGAAAAVLGFRALRTRRTELPASELASAA